jgi:hypothetical protein
MKLLPEELWCCEDSREHANENLRIPVSNLIVLIGNDVKTYLFVGL